MALVFKNNMSVFSSDIKKGEIIENIVKESTLINITKSFNTSIKIHHYCIHDIIEEDENKVTIIFYQFQLLVTKCCITRLLFQKSMTGSDYNKWLNDTKYKYEGDINARKFIFEKIQQDLDENSYSIIKDTDIIQPKVEFFEKDLPLIKYKFTDLVL